MRRLALIGYGGIGAELHQALAADHRDVIEVVAIWTRGELTGAATVPSALHVRDCAGLQAARPDIVIEAASADVVREHGAQILEFADFMPLSLTALADPVMLPDLLAKAQARSHRLLIPHGAIVGADAMLESQALWQSVAIEFRKRPNSIDSSGSVAKKAQPAAAAVLFDGSVRQIAALYPRNVNAMVACALLTVGLDACRARLVADPALERAELHIEARGSDGSELIITRRQPMRGVSGTEMARSLLGSVRRVCGVHGAMDFV